MNTALPLRSVLAANVVFSLSSALFMFLRPELVGEWLGIYAPAVFRAVGVGLAVLFFPSSLSPTGVTLVLAVAAVVFTFGLWQLWAIGNAHQSGGNGEYRHCIVVETNATVAELWPVVSNLGDIGKYVPSLKRSVVLDGKARGVGVVRTCEDHDGRQWSERCTEFNPGRSFTVRFLSEAPDFPFPARAMRGGWEVAPSAAGSQVMVCWELVPKSRLLAPVILPLLAFQVDHDFPKIIRRMAASALGEGDEVPLRPGSGVIARLLPISC